MMEGKPFLVDALLYAPYRCPGVPEIAVPGEGSAPDGLPAGQLVPVFTGLRLPLSDLRRSCERSDREDVVDYLARGPAAHGLDRGSTSGNVHAAAMPYAPILDLLSSPRVVTMDREALRAWAAAHRAQVVELAMDSRFMLEWFHDVVAVRFGGFSFVLYRPQTASGWSRLTVLPVAPQRFPFTFPLGSLEPRPLLGAPL